MVLVGFWQRMTLPIVGPRTSWCCVRFSVIKVSLVGEYVCACDAPFVFCFFALKVLLPPSHTVLSPAKGLQTTSMTEPTTTTKPDLMDCDALMLSSYLLHHRFQGDAMATASFLLEATSTLPNAEEISAQLLGNEEEEEQQAKESAASTDLGSALTNECTVSITAPRGKFQMTLYEQGIRFINSKNQVLTISPQAVQQLVLFPKPEDCRTTSKKPAGDMVLLCLQNDTTTLFNNKNLTQVCLQLPTEPPSETSTWLHLFCSSLSLHPNKQVAIVVNPKTTNSNKSRQYSFQSHNEGTTSSTTAGMPFVQCYHGVNDGVLYPMQEGLLFFK